MTILLECFLPCYSCNSKLWLRVSSPLIDHKNWKPSCEDSKIWQSNVTCPCPSPAIIKYIIYTHCSTSNISWVSVVEDFHQYIYTCIYCYLFSICLCGVIWKSEIEWVMPILKTFNWLRSKTPSVETWRFQAPFGGCVRLHKFGGPLHVKLVQTNWGKLILQCSMQSIHVDTI